MELNEVRFLLTPEQQAFLDRQAKALDLSPGQVLRDLINREMRRQAAPKTPNKADEALVARLQRLLVPDMARAGNWRDLEACLAKSGFELRPSGGGLTLHKLRCGTRLCKSSELGFAYSRFVRKFGEPMPGHPHRMAHLLHRPRRSDNNGADASTVIE